MLYLFDSLLAWEHSVARLSHLDCSLSPQSTQGELLHISLVMLVTSIFFLWFAWDAIICENAFALLASGVLGLAVCARIIYFVVRRSVSLPTYAANLLQAYSLMHICASSCVALHTASPTLHELSKKQTCILDWTVSWEQHPCTLCSQMEVLHPSAQPHKPAIQLSQPH